MDSIKKLRNRILEVAIRDGMGHIPSALSILHIIEQVYEVKGENDLFLLSKGHGVMALYAVLESKGLLDWSTKLMGHPKRGGAILASTGSLGHGFPMAIGLALAKKIKDEDGRVYVLIGDGEANEGTTWESAMLASHHKLNNLTVIVDNNHSSRRALNVGKLSDKFYAFGFSVWDIYGHRKAEIVESLKSSSEKPMCIVADTTKGKGVEFMENSPQWHNRRLSESEYNEAIK